MPTLVNWYDYPNYYDIAFQADTALEGDFVVGATAKFAGSSGPLRLFEPGCGSGRLVRELVKRGHSVTGFDINDASLRYARKRLPSTSKATLLHADMASFSLPDRDFDAAYSFCNTFRHLLDDVSARGHLESVASHLRQGGLYLLGLHLMPPDADPEDCERWTETRGHTRVTATLRVLATNWKQRIEQLRLSLCVREVNNLEAKPIRLRSDFPLRLYARRHLRQLLATVPTFELLEVFDFWYELDHPVKLDDYISDTVLVLRRR